MRVKLVPISFFIGLVCGLVSLSWLGSVAQSPHLIDGFVRFHQLINAEAGYIPTARQVKQIVDRTRNDKALICVIVGGTSVFHGVGQHESMIWTRYLQEHLGPGFRVINFAQRAGRPNDVGNIAAELLLRESRPVIYVADGTVAQFAIPYEESFFPEILIQAWHRGYLLPWAPRDQLLSRAIWSSQPKLRNVAMGALLDNYLNFNDLWNFIGFDYANSIWNPLLGTRFLDARSNLRDPELTPEQYRPLRYRADLDYTIRVVRGQIMASTDPRWSMITDLAEQTIPPPLRAVTLAVIDLNSPFYRNKLSAADRGALIEQAHEHARRLMGIGFNRAIVAAEGFSEDDYVDHVHLSVSGGQKLAAGVAPEIRDIAVKLGYLK